MDGDQCLQGAIYQMRQSVLLAVFLLSATYALGQGALATVTGTITDPSGAVIPDAPVTVRNVETGQIYLGASSGAGNYTVSQLPIGDYDLTIQVSGFKTYEHTGFHLTANQIMREDVELEVGQTTESITVEAQASLLNTETSEVAQNVTLTQLNRLPILAIGSTNEGFRDPFASTFLVPGIIYNNGSNIGAGNPAPVVQMTINGTRTNSVNVRLDGMTDIPTGSRLLGAQMETQPSVDAIQEVAIETSNFAAEYGTAGGAMINMVTKSGTNEYHGTAYDYVTNEALNSHQPYTGIRNTVKQHNWGATVGGPVWLPGLYNGRNKTFFFWSYEQFRNKNINTSNSTTVPLPAYREGDFRNLITAEHRLVTTSTGNYIDPLGNTVQSGTIFDPNTQRDVNGVQYRDPFTDNMIPVNRFDPIAMKILGMVPMPLGLNAAKGQASNNYQGTFDSSRTSSIPSIKLDQNVSDRYRFSIYYQDTHTFVPRTPTGADAFADPITQSVNSHSAGQTIRFNNDFTVTPRLLLHIGLGWNDTDFSLSPQVTNYNSLTELGLTGQTLPDYFPRLVVGTNSNVAIGGMSNLGSFFPARSMERRPSGNVAATYVAGDHTFKMGLDYRLEKYPDFRKSYTNGSYTFGTNYTEQPALLGTTTTQGFLGFQFASFLLGGMSANRQDAPVALSNNKSQTALYIQDTWKVTPKLTLDYGLRWDYGTYAAESYGRTSSVGLNIPNPSADGRLGALQFEQTCNCKFANNYPYAIGPRLGVAYRLDNNTVLRAGWGIVYNATSTSAGSFSNSASSTAFPNNSGQITGLFKNGMPASVHAMWPTFAPNVGQGIGSVIGMPTLLDQNVGRPARITQWNIGIQHTFGQNLLVQASYVANRGAWWEANSLSTVNLISQDTLHQYGFNDLTSLAESRLLTTTVGRLSSEQASILDARGFGLPYANFPTSQSVYQALRPYPQYSNGGSFFAPALNGVSGAPLGKTWYDSFQLNVTQRFSHGVTFNLNYNYSKNLDLVSSPDPFNRKLGKNLSSNDLPHQFRLTLQYQVPDLKNSGLRFVSSRIGSNILSGWGIGVYLNYQSAQLLSRPSSNGTVPLSNFLGYGPGGAQLKTDANGNYMNPWSVDWTDYDGNHHTDPLNINCHCFDPTKTIVLNPDAWQNIPNGQFGAQQQDLRFFRGFRYPTENVNFSRNFQFTERVSFNIRIEFNNIFNRTRLTQPTTTGNFANAPRTFTNGAYAGLYSSGFGTVLPTSGTNGMRTGQIIGRINF